jgi:hypothetical protein
MQCLRSQRRGHLYLIASAPLRNIDGCLRPVCVCCAACITTTGMPANGAPACGQQATRGPLNVQYCRDSSQ